MAAERDLLTHYEVHLGPLRTRFLPSSESGSLPCQYLRFEDTPVTGGTTIVTLGLSRHTLPQKSGRMIRQELLICTYSAAFDAQFVSAFDVVAREMDEMHRPLSRGQVIRHRGSLLPQIRLEAFVVMNPWYWDDRFSCFSGVVPPVYIAWLIPITKEEVECVEREGIDALEAAIESQDPDLLDLHRESMRL
jgi:Suppressor of fused protein (SUFU)